MSRLSVTAVIPAYNAAEFLPVAVAGVRGQSRAVDEIVVLDDGSSDNTADVAQSLGADIRLIVQANTGPSAARNRAVEAARGDLVAFLDADDVWLPHAIERQLRVFDAIPGVALTTGDMSAIDERGDVTLPSWFVRHGAANKVGAWASRPVPNAVAEIVRKNFIGTSVVVVRRNVFRRLGGFRTDLRYGEDLECWARIAARHPIVCLAEVLGLRRSHPTNTTKSVEPMLKDLVRMSEIIRGWGHEILARQGLDADEMVAAAQTDLGYWYFVQGRNGEARAALRSALQDHCSERALKYYVLSCLPPGAISGLRRMRLSARGHLSA